MFIGGLHPPFRLASRSVKDTMVLSTGGASRPHPFTKSRTRLLAPLGLPPFAALGSVKGLVISESLPVGDPVDFSPTGQREQSLHCRKRIIGIVIFQRLQESGRGPWIFYRPQGLQCIHAETRVRRDSKLLEVGQSARILDPTNLVEQSVLHGEHSIAWKKKFNRWVRLIGKEFSHGGQNGIRFQLEECLPEVSFLQQIRGIEQGKQFRSRVQVFYGAEQTNTGEYQFRIGVIQSGFEIEF